MPKHCRQFLNRSVSEPQQRIKLRGLLGCLIVKKVDKRLNLSSQINLWQDGVQKPMEVLPYKPWEEKAS